MHPFTTTTACPQAGATLVGMQTTSTNAHSRSSTSVTTMSLPPSPSHLLRVLSTRKDTDGVVVLNYAPPTRPLPPYEVDEVLHQFILSRCTIEFMLTCDIPITHQTMNIGSAGKCTTLARCRTMPQHHGATLRLTRTSTVLTACGVHAGVRK